MHYYIKQFLNIKNKIKTVIFITKFYKYFMNV